MNSFSYITDPFAIVTVLVVIEGSIFFLSEQRGFRRILAVVPSMFWIYFLPLVAATLKIIPPEADVYPFISRNLLPASLILLLMSVDIRAIAKLGTTALLMMFAGSAGIVLGGPIVLMIFKPWLPEGIWSGFGALSGSWTGGSANLLAVKESLHTPQSIFTLMIVIDSIIPYVWLTILIALAGYQSVFDKWNRSDLTAVRAVNRKIAAFESARSDPLTLRGAVLIFTVGFVGSAIASRVSAFLPVVPNVVASFTWTIILATLLGIFLSFTRVRNLESYGASKIGFALLYLVLATFGARATLTDLGSTPLLLVAGLVWVFIHAIFILLAARILKAPMFLAAAASQANVGGVASAPLVAQAYQPELASVGLLLAILGNIVGTYLGILCAHLCKAVG